MKWHVSSLYRDVAQAVFLTSLSFTCADMWTATATACRTRKYIATFDQIIHGSIAMIVAMFVKQKVKTTTRVSFLFADTLY